MSSGCDVRDSCRMSATRAARFCAYCETSSTSSNCWSCAAIGGRDAKHEPQACARHEAHLLVDGRELALNQFAFPSQTRALLHTRVVLGLLPVAHDDAVEELGRDRVRQAARRVKVDKLGAHVVANRVELEHEIYSGFRTPKQRCVEVAKTAMFNLFQKLKYLY